jgi:hypothetical protein
MSIDNLKPETFSIMQLKGIHLIFLLDLNEAFKNKNHDNRWAYDLELWSKVKWVLGQDLMSLS